MLKILLVDDDREMLSLTSAALGKKGYAVSTFERPDEAIVFFNRNRADCVVLDVMMPKISGFELCKEIRKISEVPVIFLTGKVAEEDKVEGLLLGADDYVEKPYSFLELDARIQAAVRRTLRSLPSKLSFPPLELDIEKHCAYCNGEDLHLTTREYDLLHFFATANRDPITYEDIGVRVWGVYNEQDRGSIMVIINRLRKKLEVNPVTARMIETVWSKGYRFAGKSAIAR